MGALTNRSSDNRSDIKSVSSRKVERNTVFSAEYSLKLELLYNNKPIETKITNIHFAGACIEIIDLCSSNIKSIQNELRINLKQGNKIIAHDISFKICWENKQFGHFLGLEFINSKIFYSRNEERFDVDKNFRPVFRFDDPLEQKRDIFSHIIDLSLSGFSVVTSISNKHLFVGMKSHGEINFINNIINISVKICNLTLEDGKIRIGFSIIKASEYQKSLKRYLATFCFDYPFEKKYMSNTLGDALTFYRISTEEQYNDVINLRLESYGSKNKVNDKSLNTFKSGLDKEGLIIGGYINGKLICSVEIKIKSEGHKFLLEEHIDIETLKYDKETLIEINKLCILSTIQKSDVLLSIFRKIHLYVLNTGCKNVVLSTTEELAGHYKKLGAHDSGVSYPHPTLKNKKLSIFYLDIDSYFNAKSINPFLWKYIYEDNHKFACENDLASSIQFNFYQKVKISIISYIFNKKMNKNKTKANMSNRSQTRNVKDSAADFSVQIIEPYILAAIKLSDKDFIETTLDELGVPLSYFKHRNNWVSIDFFDNFIDLCSKRMSTTELAIESGRLAMKKELLGVGYYILKYFGTVNILANTIKKTSEKLNTNRYITINKTSKDSMLLNIHLKDGYNLPKSKTTDLNFQEILHSGIALVLNCSKNTIQIQQLSSSYDSEGPSSFKVKWQTKNQRWKLYLLFVYIITNTIAYFFIQNIQKHLLAINLGLVAISVLVIKYQFSKVLNEINDSNNELEENGHKQYNILYTAKNKLEHHHKKINILNVISAQIHQGNDILTILETATKSICTQFDFSRCMIMLRDDSNHLITKSIYGIDDTQLLNKICNFKIDLSKGEASRKIGSTAYHSKQTLIINDIDNTINELNNLSQNLIDSLDTKSYIITPIYTQNETFGIIIADKGSNIKRKISESEVEILEGMSSQMAIAISKQYRFDDLTNTLKVLKQYNPKVFQNGKIDNKKLSLNGYKTMCVSGFLDIRNFTSITEEYSCEEVVKIINSLSSLCENALSKNFGCIDKFIGDEFFFTWENLAPESLVTHAIETIQIINDELIIYNQNAIDNKLPYIDVGIGLDIGNVIRGNIGTEKRMDFTSIGGSVNKASRLQSLNKLFNSRLIVSSEFYNLLDTENKNSFKKDVMSIRGFQKEEAIYISEEKYEKCT